MLPITLPKTNRCAPETKPSQTGISSSNHQFSGVLGAVFKMRHSLNGAGPETPSYTISHGSYWYPYAPLQALKKKTTQRFFLPMSLPLQKIPKENPFFMAMTMYISHRIHVWYMYLHLADLYGKCRWIFHTWMLIAAMGIGVPIKIDDLGVPLIFETSI